MILERIGYWLARYLQKVSPGYRPVSTFTPEKLRKVLKPGDVLLVEGNQRISIAIKYLTQSTWSHSAVYIGDDTLIEADMVAGVVKSPLSKYAAFHTRICRPVGLTEDDGKKLIEFLTSRLGTKYDMKNAIDLVRYLIPTPPVPVKWRRRMISLGSGDPTRAICSTLIAQAFEHIRFPILPIIKGQKVYSEENKEYTEQEILHIRHYSLYAPRDFDVSPYFQIIKPTIESGFDYKALVWEKMT